jgi:hypothetical protein
MVYPLMSGTAEQSAASGSLLCTQVRGRGPDSNLHNMQQTNFTHLALNEITVVVFTGAALITNKYIFISDALPVTTEPLRPRRQDSTFLTN